MNKTMQNMMKPIPVDENDRAAIRQAQEERVLNWLKTVDRSVTSRDVCNDCRNIPTMNRGHWNRPNDTRDCSQILKRLEKKGHVVSVLYGSYRYYSIPVNGGVQ